MIMKEFKLSVVIASYNSSKTIEKCLRPLESSVSHEYIEVIVVDSSEGGTADILAQRFPKVRPYTFPERKFSGNDRNLGASKAKG
jgi:GT2 family glycosyltransferase